MKTAQQLSNQNIDFYSSKYFYYFFNIKVFTCSIDGNEKNDLLLENEISDLEFY